VRVEGGFRTRDRAASWRPRPLRVSVDSRPGRSPEVRDRCTDRLPIEEQDLRNDLGVTGESWDRSGNVSDDRKDGRNSRNDLGFTGESWNRSGNVSDDRRDLRNVREDLGFTGECREWSGKMV